MSPRQSLAKESWGQKLYQQPAQEFIEEHNLEFWAEQFLNPLIRATAFLDISQISASTFLTSLLPAIIPSWEFKLHIDQIVQPFTANIRTGVTVVTSVRKDEQWVVKDSDGKTYSCVNLVLALPLTETKKLIAIREPTNKPITATVVHVRGELQEKYADSPFVFFSADSADLWITAEDGGTYLFYTQDLAYDLSKYFSRYEIIKEHRWDPAFFLGPHVLEITRGNSLYVIGGHNFASMEDAYITGIYAANQITSRKN